jgi:hypothetical protein
MKLIDTTIIAQEGGLCNKFIADFSTIYRGITDKNRQITPFDCFARTKTVL